MSKKVGESKKGEEEREVAKRETNRKGEKER